MRSGIMSTNRISDPQLRRACDSIVDVLNGNSSTGSPTHATIQDPVAQRVVLAIYNKQQGQSVDIPATAGISDVGTRQVLDSIITNIL